MTNKTRDCGWGADHAAHQHPGLDNTRCPGRGAMTNDTTIDPEVIDTDIRVLEAMRDVYGEGKPELARLFDDLIWKLHRESP